jgi:predicted ribosomally synthesized peptide with nif11-like leader
MSTAAAEKFMARIEADEAFVGRIAALDGDANAVFELVKSEGYDCTPEEIKEVFLETYGSQLTAEQLDAVAGGLSDGAAIGAAVGGFAGAVAVGVGIASAAVAAGAI